MTTFVNLTPHVINVVSDGATHAIVPSGTVARVSSTQNLVDVVNGIPMFATTFGDVVDLPAPQEDTIFVVSALVRNAVSDRTDVASPGDLVRDDAGNVVGCRGLIVNGHKPALQLAGL